MTSIKNNACCGLVLFALAACSGGPGALQRDAGMAAVPSQPGEAEVSLNPYLVDRKPVPRQAQAQFQRAVAAMADHQWSTAETLLTRLTVDYPQLSGPWLNLGIGYRALERPEQAESALRQAIAINERNLEAYNQLAALRRSAGDFAAAEALYLQALAIWPQHPASHLNLGVLYDLYLGQFDKAAVHYRAYQALQAEPDRRVAGWLMDMQRRPVMLAQAKVAP